MKYSSRIYLCLIFGILYIPILTLIFFSFNAGESTAVFSGFSFRWYKELFNSSEAFTALRNTLILAVLSALLATVIGTAAAEGIYKMRNKYVKGAIKSVTDIPMMNPDIVTGMSMMLFFAAVMAFFKIGNYDNLGFAAMLISHTTFCLPYVILSVLPRITELGNSLSEAALDLGCTPIKAFFKVKLPNILPAVLSGLVMAFTLSLDDFVISYFIAPPNFQTLPLLIYSMTKKTVKPDMFALSTIIIVTVFTLLVISNFRSDKKNSNTSRKKRITTVVALSTSVCLIFGIIIASFFVGTPTSDVITLNVYNWGEYIADGELDEDGNPTYDTNKEFEKYYKEKFGNNVVINYSTYATNEDMYSKITNSAVSYDIIIPSDYMIEKLIKESQQREAAGRDPLLLKFDVEKDIPNFVNIHDEFKNPYYDPDNTYSVPYTYGMLGIIYNKNLVSEADIAEKSWSIMWNEKYKGQILQFNNPRDAMATAMYWKGFDVNTDDESIWDEAYNLLVEQKPLLQGYVNDEIFNKMTTGSAAIATYYVGDYITMVETDGAADLGFYYPKEGTNYFVDAMCIPYTSKNPEVAKEYINFMLTKEAGVANAEYIGYASPNTLVSSDEDYIDYMGEENIELLYATLPSEVNADYNAKFGNDAACYKSFDDRIQRYTNGLWEDLKLQNSSEIWIHVATGIIIASAISLAVYSLYVKKKHSRHYRLRDKSTKKQ